MKKSELVEAIATDADVSKGKAEKALHSVLSNISNALADGQRVSFVGFGSFSVVDRPARDGRNPKTGEVIKIPAKKVVKFNAGASLKSRVN